MARIRTAVKGATANWYWQVAIRQEEPTDRVTANSQ